MTETWKDIPGDEGIYQCSDAGNIRSLERRSGGQRNRRVRGRQMKPALGNRSCTVTLTLNGKPTVKSVGYWVLHTFKGQSPNKVCIHLDGNIENNNLDNLVWGSLSDCEKVKVIDGRADYSVAKLIERNQSRAKSKPIKELEYRTKNDGDVVGFLS